MATKIEPPTPLSYRFPGDQIIAQHDQSVQQMYEALVEALRRLDALENNP